MAPLSEKVLSLQVENLSKLANPEQDISAIWNVFTKCKDNLENGHRLENLSWRLWYRSCHNHKKETTLQPLTKPMVSDVPIRKVTSQPSASLPQFQAPVIPSTAPTRITKKKLSSSPRHAAMYLKRPATPKATFFVAESTDCDSDSALSDSDISDSDLDESYTPPPLFSKVKPGFQARVVTKRSLLSVGIQRHQFRNAQMLTQPMECVKMELSTSLRQNIETDHKRPFNTVIGLHSQPMEHIQPSLGLW
ncbi:hypothetical protein EDD86DRAFT_210370 [Gorgonomyces haynaldii]|nr:hypothetical protein EDD86DRAFT_210370 [Gorgonomyces haynaldii]